MRIGSICLVLCLVSWTHRIQNISKNNNLYPQQRRITFQSLLWETLYMVDSLSNVRSKTGKKMHFLCVFCLFWTLYMTTWQPYRLSHIAALDPTDPRTNPWYFFESFLFCLPGIQSKKIHSCESFLSTGSIQQEMTLPFLSFKLSIWYFSTYGWIFYLWSASGSVQVLI